MKLCAGAFQINARGSGCYGACSITMELRWVTRKYYPKQKSSKLKSKVPVFLSTIPSHVNPQHLSHLYTLCNHSCYRFPEVDHKGQVVEPVDVKKLGVALSHSSVLVSVFCDSKDMDFEDGVGEESVVSEEEAKPSEGLGDLLMKAAPPWSPTSLSPETGRLVGFGRAVSDLGLTATIYDVVVIPSLWGMGIGSMIVKRIVRLISIHLTLLESALVLLDFLSNSGSSFELKGSLFLIPFLLIYGLTSIPFAFRMLISKEIYDISALCSSKERLFFKACGFRDDDLLGSTTMMYTRTVPTCEDGDEMGISAGRKLLLLPQLKKSL